MPKEVPELYKLFASKLNPLDWIITFNYDTLLEQALDLIGTPYRLFPRRYTEIVNNTMGIVESRGSEIEILRCMAQLTGLTEPTMTSYQKSVQSTILSLG
jgi:hypothetical protein